MPILKNAKKALRASKRKALGNMQTKQQMRSSVKSAKSSPSPESISTAFSRIDRAVKRGIIHRNKAARLKSQMSRLSIATNSTPTEKKSKTNKSTTQKSSTTKIKNKSTKNKKSTKSATV